MERRKKTKIHWGRFAGWVILIAIATWFLSKIIHTLTLFGLALLFTYLLFPLVKLVSNIEIPYFKKRIPWFPSIVIVYLLLAIILVISGIILIPNITIQVNNIIRELPGMADRVRIAFEGLQKNYNNIDMPVEIKERVTATIADITGRFGVFLENMFKSIGFFLLHLFSWVILFIIALIFAFFILMDAKLMLKGIFSYIPPGYREDIKALTTEINDIFGNYIRGNILCIIANGILTYISLYIVIFILQLVFPANDFPYYRYALVASVIAGVLFPIPYVAHALSIIIAIALAYLQIPSLTYSITIGMIVFGVFQVVDFVVRPKIMGDAMGVSTIFVFFAAIAGGEIMGGLGLLIGIPLAVMLISIVRFIYNRFLAFPVSEEIFEQTDPGSSKAGSQSGSQPSGEIKIPRLLALKQLVSPTLPDIVIPHKDPDQIEQAVIFTKDSEIIKDIKDDKNISSKNQEEALKIVEKTVEPEFDKTSPINKQENPDPDN
jgi:predicted PurR-regulated permease PerM